MGSWPACTACAGRVQCQRVFLAAARRVVGLAAVVLSGHLARCRLARCGLACRRFAGGRRCGAWGLGGRDTARCALHPFGRDLTGHAGGGAEGLLGQAGGQVAGGIQGSLLCRVLHGVGRNLLELLRQRAPPLHGVDDARGSRCGTGFAFGGGSGLRRRCHIRHTVRHARDGLGRTGQGFTGFLHAVHHGVGGLELEGVGQVAHAEIHAFQCGQGHFLHLQGLDGGRERARILLEPELHGLEFFDALLQLFNVDRRSHPIGQVGHLRDIAGCALGKVLQKIKTWHEFTETGG